ncbi:dipeptidase [Chelatococcus sp. SYSU_G07232]|uniref:Dipeptidase n=1 Tax=Chelatococcus albus TaxID=3047466 RepID=A0ABT7ALG9_9HYPH|nr:dipeptidase [Chelatococcus sp. SYSU_G07232]MDJ1160229.1 dipeptidase [Chelatococcus sp. SYSU_G07232]
MTSESVVPVFDGHNDVLLRLWKAGREESGEAFLAGEEAGHVDLPRARIGGFAGGLFAVYVPSPVEPATAATGGDRPEPLTPSMAEARRISFEMISILSRIERAAAGAFRLCRSAADIRAAMATGALAAVFHIEGAEALDPELRLLDVLHQAGLRSLGPVWSRPNIFGRGVPFRFPSSPDIGPGLTDRGRALVRACNELGILVDLSHLNERGFWDVAEVSTAPLVASHSNAHALCPHSRNLTDRQLDAIRERDGLVGVNFGAMFIRPDGRKDPATELDLLIRHVDHLVDRIGLERVAIGSDYDGTTVPHALRDVSHLQALVSALRHRGYDEAALRRICHGNWIRVLERTWGE